MGTEKRERQKANRALRQQEELKAASRKRGMRIAAIVVGGLVAVFGLVYIATLVTGDDDADTLDTIAPISTDVTDDSLATEPITSEPVTSEPVTSEPAEAVTPECPPVDGVAEPITQFTEAPPMCLEDGATYQAVVTTNLGEYTVDLDAEAAPLAVNNFVFLARNGYYDNTPCHRIITDFVIQCGDPTGTGTGGPGYTFADELPAAGAYELGSLAMANSGPDTNGSQFFVITGAQGVALPPDYTLFGQVVDGFDTTVADIAATGTEGAGTPSEPVTITSVEIIQS